MKLLVVLHFYDENLNQTQERPNTFPNNRHDKKEHTMNLKIDQMKVSPVHITEFITPNSSYNSAAHSFPCDHSRIQKLHGKFHVVLVLYLSTKQF